MKDGYRKRYGHIRFHFMDHTIIIYLLLLGFLVIPFHRDVKNWGQYPVIHLAAVFLILELLRLYALKPNKILRFFRTFYPALGLALAWGELDSCITMIFPYWANDFVVNLDLALFGVHPTVWVQTLFTPWLTEIMNFFYAFYYTFIPISAFTLYFRGREKETLDFLFTVFLAYCSVFMLFLVFPAEGPWVILKDLHTVRPEGGIFLWLNEFIQGRGSIRGGCFPSSHVAAAYAILWGTYKYQWKLGIIMTPFVFGMAAATVYCQYHHAVDALSGMLIGTLLFLVGQAMIRYRDRKIQEIQK